MLKEHKKSFIPAGNFEPTPFQPLTFKKFCENTLTSRTEIFTDNDGI